MPRVKRGVTTRAKHKSVLSKTKGYRHTRKNLIRVAKQAVLKADANRYKSRRLKKRAFRSLWIVRLNAACMANGIKYNLFIKGLTAKKIKINRKELSQLAQDSPEEFKKIVEKAKV